MKLKTEFNFILPDLTGDGNKIKGVMRLVKVKDIIEVYRDNRVKENPAYFYVVLLSRIVVKIEGEKMMNTRIIENLTSKNFAFLVDFMNEINHRVLKQFPVKCSSCGEEYLGELQLLGEL